jgi:Tfp pilus assembly protein PilO
MSSSQTPSLLRERLTSPLTWHYVAFAVLLVAVTVLSIRFGLDWEATNGSSSDALVARQFELKALDLQTTPLRGLDKRVADSRAQMKAFNDKRIPPNYSSIDRRIGELEVSSGVRLTRVQYTQGKPGADLTEISLDASITGSYPQIMHFVNSLERDQNFFIIRGLTLSSQQGGLVNLRLQVSTWLRPADAAASGLPSTPQPGEAAPKSAAAPGKEGE